MFSGIVEALGKIAKIEIAGAICNLVVEEPKLAADVEISDSVAVNGVCLTVVAKTATTLTFQAVPETLSRTNLGELREGSPVNLERALAANARLGGHFVSGHVDGLAELVKIDDHNGECADYYFRVPKTLAKNMASKGSVAVDGVSLTLVKCDPELFSVALIPFTLAATTLGSRKIGDKVNIETDILSKYVQRLF
ncbi:MAG: riboflavin synthase, partial [Thermoguttaceae bacterium]|nr:riboflavin synthase [Thermoguttaceae bacterium]